MKVLITGSQGFIGSYVCAELLENGYEVLGVDNYSKYGRISRSHDKHPNFTLIETDVKTLPQRSRKRYGLSGYSAWEFKDVDYIIAGAAMIGGISYFHKYAYDLLAENERITAATFDLALKLWSEESLKKIVVLSSSMVFENTEIYPTPEDSLFSTPPPLSTYGFQKLSTEYFAKGAYEQYGLPYTIARPFNCVGVGEDEALGEEEITSGNVKLMMSHVLPDLINKILRGQNPLHLLGSGEQIRCYTNGADIARGIRLCMEYAGVDDFNISTEEATTVKELAEIINEVIGGENVSPLNFIYEKPYEYDVQRRIPDVRKAQRVLGFTASTSLKESVEEVVNYMRNGNG